MQGQAVSVAPSSPETPDRGIAVQDQHLNLWSGSSPSAATAVPADADDVQRHAADASPWRSCAFAAGVIY